MQVIVIGSMWSGLAEGAGLTHYGSAVDLIPPKRSCISRMNNICLHTCKL